MPDRLLTHLQNLDLAPDSAEAADRARMITLLQTEPLCFARSCFSPGHFTGSALLLSHNFQQTLLTHHRFLNRWLQLGGHCDGNPDVPAAALREAREESGLGDLELVDEIPADLDIHAIPANPRKGEPPHLHFDVRYFVRATQTALHVVSEESHDLKWFTAEEALALNLDENLRRLIGKWQLRFLR